MPALWLSLALLSEPASARWLIIQEGPSDDCHDVLDPALNALGEPFDVMNGVQVGAMTADDLFATYEVIFIGVGNNQAQVTDLDVRPLITNGGVIEAFVDLGGILFVHGAHNDAANAVGPGGSVFGIYILGSATDDMPSIVDNDHEFITGVYSGGGNLVNGDFAGWGSTCHGEVDPPPGHVPSGGVNLGTSPQEDQWNEILYSPANNNSAMLEYTFGCGYVIMDMMTFDWNGAPLRDALVPESAAYVQGIQANFPFCDLDVDLDGLVESDDNCPLVFNPTQDDVDGDGLGDACDFCDNSVELDSDNDGICDSADQCPGNDFLDTDLDGVADGCDLCPVDALPDEDTDGDSVCNVDDICPNGDDLADTDLDGFADGCDACPGFDDVSDFDLDGVPDGCDNCVTLENGPQYDDDDDGEGSKCDCDDDDAAVNSSAQELCDGVDNNCDGEVDELGAIGPNSWFEDRDGDGQGNGSAVVNGCEKPDWAVGNTDDCDDTNPLVYVGAPEFCDERDTNCDGTADDEGVCVPTGPAEADPDPTSCGDCSSSGRGALPWTALVVAGLVARRRQRS